MINHYKLIELSARRIEPHIKKTPLIFDSEANIYLKCENHQVTGSFKVRGALNKVLTLSPDELDRGLVTASAGNHGLGVALSSNLVGTSATIFCSENAVQTKVQAIKAMGANIKFVKGGYAQAEIAAKKYALESHACWISPYNDQLVIAGQATLAMEIMDELSEQADATWCVPVGGGGLISGIGCFLQSVGSQVRLIGVQSQASPFFHSIFYHGTQNGITEKPSLADGLSGRVDPESITIQWIKRTVDDIILVSEDEIRDAIRYAWTKYNQIIEGSAAVALAAVMTNRVTSRPVVVILSGGNVQPEIHVRIVGMSS
ncbi:MAG: pyridoxal-phosphate dependent enzyme [Anaerolineales bacterium]|nr:pyridoxal-phosphate dependent enzyme [Anaerolineales bacterium]